MKYVCSVSEVAPGEMKAFAISGKTILIINFQGRIKACQGICPHQDVPLETGILDGCILTCLSHLWQWNIETEEIEAEAEQNLRYFKTETKDGNIYVCDE